MKELDMSMVTDAEYENLENCVKENPDPIGARNWKTDQTIIEKIKKLKRTERLTTLRNRLLDSKQQLYIKERGKLVTESYKETIGEDQNVRQAKALKHVLDNYPIYIRSDELIAGSITPTPRGCLWFPEVSDWLINEIDTISTRPYNPTLVSDEDKKYYLEEIHPYWENRCNFARIQKQLPDEVREKQKYGLWSCGISMEQPIGHILSLDKKRLEKGIKWYKDQAEEFIETADKCDPKYIDRLQFWRSIIIVCDAVHDFACRYADEASRLAEKENDPVRKKELLKMAATLNKVPWNKPDTFYEAVQSAWFMQLIYYYESNAVAESPGRVDQKLYEYFKRDLDNGDLTIEEAEDIVACYWLKIAETNKVYTQGESRYRTGNPMFQNTSIGGSDAENKCAVNELSYLCLKIEEFVHLDQPNLAVWVDDNTPDDFIEEAVKVVRTGGGKPMFLGSKARINHFMKCCGLNEKEARTYDSVCCSFMWHPCLPNMDHAADVNPGIALEYVFTNGRDRRTGTQVGPKTGDPKEFKSIDDVFDALVKQIQYGISMATLHANTIYKLWQDFLRMPYTSMFQGTALKDGFDVTCGGSLGHSAAMGVSVGLVNCVDSLSAVEKIIFDDRRSSMADLVDALDKNFIGYERLQELLLNAPKYGSDNDYADKWMLPIEHSINHEYLKYPMRFGRQRKNPVYIHLSAGVLYGSIMGATPDGRKAGMPLAEGGISPMQGLKLNGPSASMRSAAKWDYSEINSVVYNQKFHPRVLEKDEDVKKLSDLIKIYLTKMGNDGLGANHVQINVVSAETLRDAQIHPEKYRDLIIRVAGYTAFFTEISKDLQDDLIARVEFDGIN